MVLTIGNFDGVHRGHLSLIAKNVEKAKEINGLSVVLTFSPHPSRVLRPEAPTPQIMPLEETLEYFDRAGVEALIVQPFTRDFSRHSAAQFVKDVLFQKVRPQCFVVGYDFAFGADRGGSKELLLDLGRQLGFEVYEAEPLLIEGRPVSSSWLRELLASGEIEKLNDLLGRTYSVVGPVIEGHARGRGLSFPTANIKTDREILPYIGVYATVVTWQERRYRSVTNVGYSPTFQQVGPPRPTIETHIFDFSQDLYGETIEVSFCIRLRDEKKFPSVEALRRQISEDVKAAELYFERQGL